MKRNKPTTLKLLVVDDEPSVVELVKDYASQMDYLEFYGCCLPQEALLWARTHHFDIALLDYRMQEMTGLEMVSKLKPKKPKSFFILMTAYAELQTAIKAIRSGVFDFLTKPFERQEFELAVQRIREQIKLRDQNVFLRDLLQDTHGRGKLIGQSMVMNSIRKKIKLYARSDASVLITGETGVGKEVVARMIHTLSNRNKSAFVAVNCGVFVETLLESEFFGHEKGAFTGADRQRIGRLEFAKEGTVLLDEICEMAPSIQVKLLRVLQEKNFERVGGNEPVNFKGRIISATNRNIKQELQSNRFRGDLYYRLNTLPIHIPPLREREGDIELFASHFLRKFSLIYNKEISSFTDGAMEIMRNHPWPGNVRQLENVVDFAALSTESDQIGEENLPEDVFEELTPFQPQRPVLHDFYASDEDIPAKISNMEKSKIATVLEKNRWNKTKTAAALGLTRGQLLYRLNKYSIK